MGIEQWGSRGTAQRFNSHKVSHPCCPELKSEVCQLEADHPPCHRSPKRGKDMGHLQVYEHRRSTRVLPKLGSLANSREHCIVLPKRSRLAGGKGQRRAAYPKQTQTCSGRYKRATNGKDKLRASLFLSVLYPLFNHLTK